MNIDSYNVVDTRCEAVVSTETLFCCVQKYTEGGWNELFEVCTPAGRREEISSQKSCCKRGVCISMWRHMTSGCDRFL